MRDNVSQEIAAGPLPAWPRAPRVKRDCAHQGPGAVSLSEAQSRTRSGIRRCRLMRDAAAASSHESSIWTLSSAALRGEGDA